MKTKLEEEIPAASFSNLSPDEKAMFDDLVAEEFSQREALAVIDRKRELVREMVLHEEYRRLAGD